MHTRIDFIVLLLASFGIGCLFALTWDPAVNSDYFVLAQSASGIQHIDLNQAAIYVIKSKQGTSEIEIKDHTARFIHSNCRNKICIQNGWLSRLRPVIACLPNAVSIQLVNNTPGSSSLDAMAF